MFGDTSPYASLLWLRDPRALTLAGECLSASPDPDAELKALLKNGWREHLVAGAAMLSGGASRASLEAMWEALDADSWAVPQLVVLLSVLDPVALDQMKKRILLGCPVKLIGQEELDPVSRHVIHGKSSILRHSDKAWSAICWRIFLTEPEWLLQRFGADEVWRRLLDPYGYEGADIANDWHRKLRELRPDLQMPPALQREGPPVNVSIARHWRRPEKRESYQCPDDTLEVLLQGEYAPSNLIYSLLKVGLKKGDRIFEITSEAVSSAHSEFRISPGIRSLIIRHLSLGWGSDVGRLYLNDEFPELWFLWIGEKLRLWLRGPCRQLEGRIELSRDRLECANTDVICYGAKDTGEMGGGAAMAVYQSCGPEVLEAARRSLAESSREIGEVVYTPAYDHECTIYVGHIVSIKTKTSQGDWCPYPERLGEGVYKALKRLPERARTIAFSCLATGEGRAQPEEIARLMLGAVRRFFSEEPESLVQVLFCLPDYDDYQAFQRAL